MQLKFPTLFASKSSSKMIYSKRSLTQACLNLIDDLSRFKVSNFS